MKLICLKNKKGFTLIEIIIVVAIIAILVGTLIGLLEPAKRMAQSRNSTRWIEVKTIAEEILKLEVDRPEKAEILNAKLGNKLTLLGDIDVNCQMSCGESELFNYNPLSQFEAVDLKTYSLRNWFNLDDVYQLSDLHIELALKCNGICNEDLYVRIGNNNKSQKYLFAKSNMLSAVDPFVWVEKSFDLRKEDLGESFYVEFSSPENDLMVFKDTDGIDSLKVEFLNKFSNWQTDSGDFLIKVNFIEETSLNCVDVSQLMKVPVDPLFDAKDRKSFYAVKKNSKSSLTVRSCKAELEDNIRSIR